jgi:hypothetical protein
MLAKIEPIIRNGMIAGWGSERIAAAVLAALLPMIADE